MSCIASHLYEKLSIAIYNLARNQLKIHYRKLGKTFQNHCTMIVKKPTAIINDIITDQFFHINQGENYNYHYGKPEA